MQDFQIYISFLVFEVHICALKENLFVSLSDTIQSFCVIVRLWPVSICAWLSVFVQRGLSVKPVWEDDITVTGGDRCWGQMTTPLCVDRRQEEGHNDRGYKEFWVYIKAMLNRKVSDQKNSVAKNFVSQAKINDLCYWIKSRMLELFSRGADGFSHRILHLLPTLILVQVRGCKLVSQSWV